METLEKFSNAEIDSRLARLAKSKNKTVRGPEGFVKNLKNHQQEKQVDGIPADKKNAEEKLNNQERNPTQGFSAQGKFRKRKYISVKIKRKLFAEAHYQCQHIDPLSGLCCESKFQLQMDHIQPIAYGGTDKFENLRILCAIHNRQRNNIA